MPDDRFRMSNTRHITLAEADDLAAEKCLRFLPEYRSVEGWTHCLIDPRDLRNMHGELSLGRIAASKFERHCEIAARLAPDDPALAAIKESLFALRADKAIWVCISRNGNAYVGDGNHRALNACIHRDTWIEAITVRVAEVADWVQKSDTALRGGCVPCNTAPPNCT